MERADRVFESSISDWYRFVTDQPEGTRVFEENRLFDELSAQAYFVMPGEDPVPGDDTCPEPVNLLTISRGWPDMGASHVRIKASATRREEGGALLLAVLYDKARSRFEILFKVGGDASLPKLARIEHVSYEAVSGRVFLLYLEVSRRRLSPRSPRTSSAEKASSKW